MLEVALIAKYSTSEEEFTITAAGHRAIVKARTGGFGLEPANKKTESIISIVGHGSREVNDERISRVSSQIPKLKRLVD